MLDPESTWVDRFKKLPPARTPLEGITNLANLIEELTNKVDADLPGSQVSPGIFKWNKQIFITLMLQLKPTQGDDWIEKVSNAWMSGCSSGIITPGTVTSPQWAVSNTDVNTAPSVPATVPTVAAGKAAVASILGQVRAMVSLSPEKSPDLYGKAFRAGIAAFTFTLIGISGSPSSPVPLTLTAKAK
jgi:hypothetical protein